MSRRKAAKYAVVAVACAIILGYVSWISRPVHSGPDKILLGLDGNPRVVADDTLNVFDGAGVRTASLPLHGLWRGGIASDIAEVADGYLIADAHQRDLVHCDARIESCRSLYQSGGAGGGALGDSLKLAVDTGGQRIFLADTSNHRLLELDADGRLRRTIPAQGQESQFFYPNQISLSGPHELVVADTNHHRLAAFDPDGDFSKPLWEFRVDRHPKAGHGRVWPAAFAHLGANWWVINEDNGMAYGNLLGFDIEGKPLEQDTPWYLADPRSLVADGDALLVPDKDQFAVFRINTGSGIVAQFGDTAFKEELAALRIERYANRRWVSLAPVVIAGCALIAAVLLKLLGERASSETLWPQWRPAESLRLAVPAEPMAWIEPYPEIESKIRLGRWLIVIMALLYPLLILGLAVVVSPPHRTVGFELQRYGWLIAAMLVLVATILLQPRLGAAIAVDDDNIRIRDKAGRIREMPLYQVRYGNRALYLGARVVQLTTGQGATVYPPDRIRDEVLARLPPGNFVTMRGALLHLIGKGNVSAILTAGFLIVYLFRAIAILLRMH